MKETSFQKQNSFNYLKLFILFVLALFIVSFLVRAVITIYESKFKDASFYLLTTKDDRPYVIHFDSGSGQINTVELFKKNFYPGKILKTSIESEIPIDAYTQKSLTKTSSLPFVISHFLAPIGTDDIIGMNAVDLFKIWFLTLKTNVSNKNTVLLGKNQELLTHNNALYDAIKDPGIVNEKISIEVINKSGVNGLGGKYSAMLKNLGVSVVSTSTGPESAKSVIINRAQDSKTVQKLIHLLNFNYIKENGGGIADITIEIGEDVKSKL